MAKLHLQQVDNNNYAPRRGLSESAITPMMTWFFRFSPLTMSGIVVSHAAGETDGSRMLGKGRLMHISKKKNSKYFGPSK